VFSPDGRLLRALMEGESEILDTQTGRSVCSSTSSDREHPTDPFIEDMAVLVTGRPSPPIAVARGHRDRVTCIRIDESLGLVATGDQQGVIVELFLLLLFCFEQFFLEIFVQIEIYLLIVLVFPYIVYYYVVVTLI
jgi:hypothetical protein